MATTSAGTYKLENITPKDYLTIKLLKFKNMKQIVITNQPLADYYENLPEPLFPKSEFIMALSIACNVTSTTVRNWTKSKVIPDKNHWATIEQTCGAPITQLFPQIKEQPKNTLL